jgi:hypothetical protein
MKPITEYQKKDEIGNIYYEDEEGLYYETLENFLQIKVLGFCGCGDPESVLTLIHDLLIIKEKISNIDHTNKSYNDLQPIYESFRQEKHKLFSDNLEAIEWYFEYLLDKKDITTHGGNVSGSWIDDENFFEALKLWKIQYESDC